MVVLGDDHPTYDVGLVAPLVGVVGYTESCDPAVRIVGDVHRIVVPSIADRVAASRGLIESITEITYGHVLTDLSILTLVHLTPATSPHPPRLTPVLVRIRPQSRPSVRIA